MFDLQPWEVPPDARARQMGPQTLGPFPWQGAPTRMDARPLLRDNGSALLFFCPQNSAINFAVARGEAPADFAGNINAAKMARVIERALRDQEFGFGRLFYLGGHACFLTQGEARWLAPQIRFRTRPDERNPRFDLPPNLAAQDSARVFAWLEGQWNDAGSQVRFAWEWNRKTYAEKHEFLRAQFPRLRETLDLMRAIAQALAMGANTRWLFSAPGVSVSTGDLHREKLAAWARLLERHFAPFETLLSAEAHCLRDYSTFLDEHLCADGGESSFHQQLEARLFVRDWLARHAPDQLHLLP